MKKIFTLALSFCLLVASTMNVFANESTSINANEMTVPVTYDVPSSYSIYIPATLDMSAGEYVFQAAILDILPSEIVTIYCKDDIPMTSEEGYSGTLWLYSNNTSDTSRVAEFQYGNTSSLLTMMGQMSAEHAGHYTGTATFIINIENQ